MSRRTRLIEVAFPLEEVSKYARQEKSGGRQGHISTLHLWWARRPLAACRAFIYASLVDDPGDGAEREELLREVADLASWDAVRKPETVVRTRAQGGSGLTGAALLERARARILRDNDGRPPRLLDPFAGGGAIPLEALRLGCEVEASDLNPVAMLILKGTVEYPQRYGRPLAEQRTARERGERDSIAGVDGDVPAYIRETGGQGQSSFAEADAVRAYERNPLAADVRYWGNWMLERARAELAPYYPPDPDGSVPVAYLWSRTVPCPNCGAEMPLIRQYWLARKDKKKVALQPVLDRANNRVDFAVVEGLNVTGDPAKATTSRGDTLCLLCRQVVKAEYVRNFAQTTGLGSELTAVVLESGGTGGKRYRTPLQHDEAAFATATERIERAAGEMIDDLPLIPNEPIDPLHHDVNRPVMYGSDTWGKLFNARQLLALTTFARLVRAAHAAMLEAGLDVGYAKAVATYLGLAVDRLADWSSTLCRWIPVGEKVGNTFSRQALPMVWDYAEANVLFGKSWSFQDCIEWIGHNIEANSVTSASIADVVRRDARSPSSTSINICMTDPPYYDAINYADLSDFFYVLAKRSIGWLHADELSLPLTPKREQIVMNVYNPDAEQEQGGYRDSARQHYVSGMRDAFVAISGSLVPNGVIGVVFAHTDADAWGTLIDGLLDAGLIPDASWPIDTEREGKVSALDQARLKTSVWMACKLREVEAGEAFIGDVIEEMRPVIQERLLYFWSKGIRGADFFISAIGPALSVFGRHTRVLQPDGGEVSVRDFLDLVRRESTRVALEQVLHGADLGQVDPATRLAVTWVWSYSRAPLDAGEAIALCLATGADYRELVRPGAAAQEAKEGSKKLVRLRLIRDRGRDQEDLGIDTPARPAPLVDQLHRAAWLWGRNQGEALAAYRAALGETRWTALRTLGQAMAESLPEGDEDRRLINGLLGSTVMAMARPAALAAVPERPVLPGFERDGAG